MTTTLPLEFTINMLRKTGIFYDDAGEIFCKITSIEIDTRDSEVEVRFMNGNIPVWAIATPREVDETVVLMDLDIRLKADGL